MSKVLLTIMLISFSMLSTGCNGPRNYNGSMIDKKGYKEETHTICISDTLYFLQDPDDLFVYFRQACKAAVNSYIQVGFEYNDNIGYSFSYINGPNYIVLFLSPDKSECVVATFCIDGSIDYEKFRNYFIEACESIDNPWDPIITES